MELVGELNVAKNGLTFLATVAEEEYGNRGLARRIKEQHAGLRRLAEELQAAVMDMRMLPLSVAFARFPRLVRDLARKLDKPIELVTEGEDTMADKDIIEALADPLVHLVRNSVDHGIEAPDERASAGKSQPAQIRLSAFSDGDAVVVEVIDNGRGIDLGKVRRRAYERGLISQQQVAALTEQETTNLVFLPGFSTLDAVSDISGRGVGMDVVRTSVERMGGSVTLAPRPCGGTVARLRLPLSMAVTQVVVVAVAGQRLGVPVDAVVETARVRPDELTYVLHERVMVLRGDVIPVLDLADRLGLRPTDDPGGLRSILVVRVGGHRVGLLVERFYREVDVIVKPLDGLLAEVATFTGTALLGDGLVLLVLNVKEVLGGVAAAA